MAQGNAAEAVAASAEPAVQAPVDDLFAAPEFNVALPPGIALCPAHSVEDEAVQGAQTILDWLQAGKTRLAIVAQDRVVASDVRPGDYGPVRG